MDNVVDLFGEPVQSDEESDAEFEETVKAALTIMMNEVQEIIMAGDVTNLMIFGTDLNGEITVCRIMADPGIPGQAIIGQLEIAKICVKEYCEEFTN